MGAAIKSSFVDEIHDRHKRDLTSCSINSSTCGKHDRLWQVAASCSAWYPRLRRRSWRSICKSSTDDARRCDARLRETILLLQPSAKRLRLETKWHCRSEVVLQTSLGDKNRGSILCEPDWESHLLATRLRELTSFAQLKQVSWKRSGKFHEGKSLYIRAEAKQPEPDADKSRKSVRWSNTAARFVFWRIPCSGCCRQNPATAKNKWTEVARCYIIKRIATVKREAERCCEEEESVFSCTGSLYSSYLATKTVTS